MLAAGYITAKAGGPKKAIFDKDTQEKIGKVQEVRQMHQRLTKSVSPAGSDALSQSLA